MKIGFIGHTFKRHSVGHLLFWTLAAFPQGHSLHFYNPGTDCDDEMAQWFSQKGTLYNCANVTVLDMVKDIIDDGIQVLIDLDGATLYKTGAVIAGVNALTKIPTISWMGFAPSGICRYAIVDPYLAPNRDLYTERLLYMPHCHITAGGFDSMAPEWSRNQLGIPDDATVLFFGQKPMKITEQLFDALRCILDSTGDDFHVLIKAFFDEGSQDNVRAKVGHNVRVHFLPPSVNEAAARGNLRLCDIVLDSFPYNGTLTSLDALWMGIPVVTVAGRGWASRQGASLIHNCGVECPQEFVHDTLQGAAQWIIDGHLFGLIPGWKQEVSAGFNKAPLWRFREFSQDFCSLLESVV